MNFPLALGQRTPTAAPARRGRARAAAKHETPYVVRFDWQQRVQHVLMLTSFTVLAVTGLPQKFDDFAVSQWAIQAMGGLEFTRLVHHVAAWVMLFDCAYHVLYLAWQIGTRRRRDAFSAVMGPQDLRDLWATMRYFLGLSRQKPDFGRFTYLEKFDYFAVFWGIVIIGGSGLVLLFPVAFTRFLPGMAIPIAFTAHSDEAVLAIGWIAVVHMFYAHLAPGVFPFNRSIFTGKVPAEMARRDHPLWFARLVRDEHLGPPAVEERAARDPSLGVLPTPKGAPNTSNGASTGGTPESTLSMPHLADGLPAREG